MEKNLLIKNGLVLTLDSSNNAGYFDLLIKDGKIHKIKYEGESNNERTVLEEHSGAEVFDAANKVIIPSLFNSNINSSYSLCRLFFRKSNYDNLDENESLKFVDKYFTDEKNKDVLYNLLRQNYIKTILNGEAVLNETSSYITGGVLDRLNDYENILSDDIYFTVYESELENYFKTKKKFYCKGLLDEEITNYSLNSFKQSLSYQKNKMFLEVLHDTKCVEEIRRNFGKSLLNILKDNELLDSGLILTNPVFLRGDDIELLYENDVNIVFCPTDFLRLSKRNIEFEEYLKFGVNTAIGTGYLGSDILSELKTFAALVNKNFYTYDQIIKMATVNSSIVFNLANKYGCIEKNKLANLVFFDLSDVRNILNIPELEPDKISEFIIESLSVKDISDVMVNGNFIVSDYSCKLYDTEKLKQVNGDLVEKIYKVGKYTEHKEKYITRKQVKEVLQSNMDLVKESESTIETLDESFESVTEGSEFRVVGEKESEILKPQDELVYKDEEILDLLSEIESFDKGMKLLDEDEIEYQEDQTDEKKKEKKDLEKVYSFDDIYESTENSDVDVNKPDLSESSKEVKKLYFDDFATGDSTVDKEKKHTKKDQSEKKEKDEVKFKKGKMKFGFSDDKEKK